MDAAVHKYTYTNTHIHAYNLKIS